MIRFDTIKYIEILKGSTTPVSITLMDKSTKKKELWTHWQDVSELKSMLNECTMAGFDIILNGLDQLENLIGPIDKASVIDILRWTQIFYPNTDDSKLWPDGNYKKFDFELFEEDRVFSKVLEKAESVMGDKLLEFNRYINSKLFQIKRQQKHKWRFDPVKTIEGIQSLEADLKVLEDELQNIMPVPTKKVVKKRPKRGLSLKSGELSAAGKSWINLCRSRGFTEDYEGEIIYRIPTGQKANVTSVVQVKKWLFSLGWEPETFKVVKNKSTGVRKKVEQICLPNSGGDLCPSVLRLAKKEPGISTLEGAFRKKSRLGVLNGFISNADENEELIATIAGFTNTLRFKHKILVNLPKEYLIRSCLISRPGKILVNWDMDSLEDKCKQHYIYYYDPNYVNEMQVPGFDPHLDLGRVMGWLKESEISNYKEICKLKEENKATESDIKEYKRIKPKRDVLKTTNYAATYKCGAPTLARTAGVTVSEAETILKGYWGRNWAILKFEKDCLIKNIGKEHWVQNPVNKFWYSLRTEKDIFSTVNQSTGSFCFDIVTFIMAKYFKDTNIGQFHDEQTDEILDNDENKDYFCRGLKYSLDEANKFLNLNVKLSSKPSFGYNYMDIH